VKADRSCCTFMLYNPPWVRRRAGSCSRPFGFPPLLEGNLRVVLFRVSLGGGFRLGDLVSFLLLRSGSWPVRACFSSASRALGAFVSIFALAPWYLCQATSALCSSEYLASSLSCR